MAVTFVGYSSAVGSGSDPSGAQAGDYLFAVIWDPTGSSASLTNTPPWTIYIDTYNNGISTPIGTVWVAIRGSSPTTYSLQSASGATIVVFAFRGAGVIDLIGGGSFTFGSISQSWGSTRYNDDLLFGIYFDASSNSITAPSGMTHIGPTTHVSAAYKTVSTSGSSGTMTWGNTGSSAGTGYLALTPSNESAASNITTAYTNVFASTAGSITSTITATSSVTAFLVTAHVSSTVAATSSVAITETLTGLVQTTAGPSTSALTKVTGQANINPVSLFIECQFNGVWTNISSYVLWRSGMSINRGRRDESSVSDVSNCTFDVKNPDGRFSALNPNSPYAGSINMNTPGRVWVLNNTTVLTVPQDGNGIYGPYNLTLNNNLIIGGMTCSTSPALQVTGNLELQIDCNIDDWGANTYSLHLIDKILYGLKLSAGFVVLYWTPDGTTFPSAISTYPLPKPWHGRKAIKATLQVNVSGNWNVNYYYAKSFADAATNGWTQLGSTVIGSGTTSITQSSDNVLVGGIFLGKIYGVNIYSGLFSSGGTLIANPDFTAQLNNTTTFNDTSGNTWNIYNSAEIHHRNHRAHGVIPSWPMQWDPTGRDVYTSIELSGILRRISQGVVANSAYYRGMTKNPPTNVLGYWPCEDAVGSTVITPVIGNSYGVITGPVALASDSSYPGSAAIAVCNTGSYITFPIPGAALTTAYTFRWIGQITSTQTASDIITITMYMSGTASVYQIGQQGTTMNIIVLDSFGNTLLSTNVSFSTVFLPSQYQLDLSISGATITVTISIFNVDATVINVHTSTFTGYTLGAPVKVVFNPSGANTGVSVGHFTVFNTNPNNQSQLTLLDGWDNESAADRFTRLCWEENIPCTVYGSGPTTLMGPQTIISILQLLRECETADDGIIFDSREQVGLCYRTRDSMATYAGAVVSLNYTNADLSDIKPTYDDLLIKNVVQYSKTNGNTVTVLDSTGTRSVNLIGQYGDSVTGNVQYDVMLFNLANWRLHIGIVDEYRYPNITVKMTRTNFSRTALGAIVQTLEIGDLLVINNPPPWLPPYPIRQIVQGFSEKLNSTDWDIIPNLAPASPFDIGQYADNGVTRYNTQQSVLTASINTTVTSFQVTTISGPVWTTTSSSLPFDIVIDGERMTVTSVDILLSPQTFTVLRSVNGIVASHLINASVSLFHISYYTSVV